MAALVALGKHLGMFAQRTQNTNVHYAISDKPMTKDEWVRVTDHNRHDANVRADFATLKNRRDCLLGTGGTSAHRAAVRPVRSSQESTRP
jgi:hypothetical protein